MTAPLPSESVNAIGLAVMHLSEVVHRYRSVIARARYRLDPTAGMTIVALHLRGPMTPREIASAVNLTPPATTELLDRLEHSGYIVRRPHPTDRRKVLVSPTAAATALSQRELHDLARIIGPVLAELTGGDGGASSGAGEPGAGSSGRAGPDATAGSDGEAGSSTDTGPNPGAGRGSGMGGEGLLQALLTLLTELIGRVEATSEQILAQSS